MQKKQPRFKTRLDRLFLDDFGMENPKIDTHLANYEKRYREYFTKTLKGTKQAKLATIFANINLIE